MSLLNFWCSEVAAAVVIDTAASGPSGTAHCSKLHYLPLANLVVAGRGFLPYTRIIYDALYSMVLDYDGALPEMPKILALADEESAKASQGFGQTFDVAQQSVALIGWSKRLSRFIGTHYRRETMAGGYKVQHMAWAVAPADPELGDWPIAQPCNTSDLVAIATWQINKGRGIYGTSGFGGDLIVVELSRQGASIRTHAQRGRSDDSPAPSAGP